MSNMFVTPLEPVLVIGGIAVFKDVWPNVDSTISALENAAKNYENSEFLWHKAETFGAGAMQEYRTNRTADLTFAAMHGKDNEIKSIHNGLTLTLQGALDFYKAKFLESHQKLQSEPFQVLRYSTGQEYKAHADGGPGISRDVSAILYLNEDYEGGELEFPHFDLKLKPSAGMYVIFPSNFPYAHIAHPVRSGTKYAIVTWLRLFE